MSPRHDDNPDVREDGVINTRGRACTKEELYFALLAEGSLGVFSRQTIMNAATEPRGRKRAGECDPQKWMGDNVPGNPEYDRRRTASLALLERVAAVADRPRVEGERSEG